MRRAWLGVALAGFVAQPSVLVAEPEPPLAAALPVPKELADAVAAAERRGRELYAHDQAAWHATDAAKPGSRQWRRSVQGWITVPRAGAQRPLVRFVGETAPGVWASRADGGDELVAQFITHILSRSPAETHVFTALDYGMPLIVGTEAGTWETASGEIRLLEERER